MRTLFGVVAISGALLLPGCSSVPIGSTIESGSSKGALLHGTVHGGQQPVSGASVYLYAANTTGYGSASISLLGGAGYVTTAPDGTFSVTSDYTCPSWTSQVYVYAVGGSAGSGTNSAIGLLAGLGSCGTLLSEGASFPFIYVNEISTIATAYAIAGFATDATHVSSSSTTLGQTGIVNAFAAIPNLENLSTGLARATTPAGNGTVPQTEINTLANILAGCVNSTSSSSTGCSTLLGTATNASGTEPTDTATAAINIAHNPGANVATLYGLATAIAPFEPALTSQPNDFTISITYTGGAMDQPGAPAVDSSGNIWVGNNTTVSEFNSNGVPSANSPISGSGQVNEPAGIAIDVSGNVWVTNSGNNTLSEFNSSGTANSNSPFSGGGLADPWGIAFDKNGNLWVANYAGGSNSDGSVSEFSSSGAANPNSPFSGSGLDFPLAVAVDSSGNIWATNQGDFVISEFSGSNGAALAGSTSYNGLDYNLGYSDSIAIDGSNDIWAPNDQNSDLVEFNSSLGFLSGSGGFTGGGEFSPLFVAIDGAGNVWAANYYNDYSGSASTQGSISEFNASGTPISGQYGYISSGTNIPNGIAIDGSGNVWVPNAGSSTLTEFVGVATPVVTPIVANLQSSNGGHAVNPPYYNSFALPAPNPATLSSGTVSQSYAGSIAASGGTGPFVWTVNGAAVPTNGSQISIGDGLSVSNNGGNTLSATGTPSSATPQGSPLTFSAQIKDTSTGNVAGPDAYTIAVNAATAVLLPTPPVSSLPAASVGASYNGAINASGGVAPYTWTINGSSAITASGYSLGNGLTAYNSGSNTLSITGTPTCSTPPCTVNLTNVEVVDSQDTNSTQSYTITVNSTAVPYTVSGTVTYSGSYTGWVYLALQPTSCSTACQSNLGTAVNGTTAGSLSTGTAYTINGVPPGTYTLEAYLDNVGYGIINASNPTATLANITVTSAGLSSQNITLNSGSTVTLGPSSTPPFISSISAATGIAIVTFKNVPTNGNGQELAASYTIEWSTSSTCSSPAGSETYLAGVEQNGPVIVSGLGSGPYYFCIAANVGSSYNSTTSGPYSSGYGPVTIAAPSGGNAVSGTVTLPSGVTPTGPLYVGFYNQNTNAVYADVIASPTAGTDSYSVSVPTGSDYTMFAVLDQQKTGIITAGGGAISNVNEENLPTVDISGPLTQNLTLLTDPNNTTLPANSQFVVQTRNNQGTSYGLNLQVQALYKLPVSVEVTQETPASGGAQDIIIPADIATGAFNDEDDEFLYSPNLNDNTPAAGDSYNVFVTYSDGTSETLTTPVSAVLDAFTTNMNPTGTGVSLTPNFSWTDPSSAGSYSYIFQLQENGNTIWQIPGQHSNGLGFPDSITSITWDQDPLNTGNLPSVNSLSSNSNYSWQITVQDANGNQAVNQVNFQTTTAALTLPATGPGPAVVGYPYGETIDANGGSGSGYVFTVNGNTVTPTPATFSGMDGLYFASSGNALTISGTPTTASSGIVLTVQVTDSASDNVSQNYTLVVSSGPGSTGVNDANLKGTYTCLTTGFNDSDGSRFASLASVVFNGSGGLTSGVFDENSRDNSSAQSGTLTGTYSVGSDNNGLLTASSVITSGGSGTTTSTYAIALTNATSPAQQFSMVEMDDVGAAPSGQHSTGNCYLTTPSAFTASTISGNGFVFGLQGESNSGVPDATAGRFTASTDGTITEGYVDSFEGSSSTDNGGALSGGSYTTPNLTTGRSTVILTGSGGSLNFAFYIIDANRAFMLETDSGNGMEAGDVRTQQQSSYSGTNLSGPFVLYMQGPEYLSAGSSTPEDYTAQVFQGTGTPTGTYTSNININQSYEDEGGTYSAGSSNGGPLAFTFDSSNPGRATGSTSGSAVYMYFFNTNSALIVVGSQGEVHTLWGWVEPQTLATFTDAAIAGTSMVGTLPLAEADADGDIGEAIVGSGGSISDGISSGGEEYFSWDQPLSATYAWDTTAPGTGTYIITSSQGGNLSCAAISAANSVCIGQTSSNPSVTTLQQ